MKTVLSKIEHGMKEIRGEINTQEEQMKAIVKGRVIKAEEHIRGKRGKIEGEKEVGAK